MLKTKTNTKWSIFIRLINCEITSHNRYVTLNFIKCFQYKNVPGLQNYKLKFQIIFFFLVPEFKQLQLNKNTLGKHKSNSNNTYKRSYLLYWRNGTMFYDSNCIRKCICEFLNHEIWKKYNVVFCTKSEFIKKKKKKKRIRLQLKVLL